MILANRVLVLGLNPSEADELSKIDGNYLFIRVTNFEKLQSVKKKYDCLVIAESELKNLSSILGSFDPKKVFIVTDKEAFDEFTVIARPLRAMDVQGILDTQLGEFRLPPKDTGLIQKGSIVKNKLFPEWGLGHVQDDLGDGNFLIKFTNTEKLMKKAEITCHKSLLRIICTIQEFTYENR